MLIEQHFREMRHPFDVCFTQTVSENLTVLSPRFIVHAPRFC